VRISVECGGLASAADACRTANQTAALLTESLAGKLTGLAGMAGNDASSAELATAYDAAAAGRRMLEAGWPDARSIGAALIEPVEPIVVTRIFEEAAGA